MSEHSFSTGRVPPKTRHDDAVLVVVESQSFIAFDRWIDAELAQLVDRWAHMASPKAKRATGFDRGVRG